MTGIPVLDQYPQHGIDALREMFYERGAKIPPDDSVEVGIIKGLVSHTINDISREQMNRIIRRLTDIPSEERLAPQRVGTILREELGEKKALEYADKAVGNGMVRVRDYEALRAAILFNVPKNERPGNAVEQQARQLVYGQQKLQKDLGAIRQMGDKSLERAASTLNKDIDRIRRSWGMTGKGKVI